MPDATPPASARPLGSGAPPSAIPGAVTGHARTGGGALVRTVHAAIEVAFVDDATARVTLHPGGEVAEPASWAVGAAAVSGPSHLEVTGTDDALVLGTPALRVRVDRATGRLRFEAPAGRVLVEDEAGLAWRPGTNGQAGRAEAVALSLRLRPGERLLGLGDKAGALDRRGRAYAHWNTDAYRYQRGTDPLYKSVPFVLGLLPATDTDGPDGDALAYGLFVDTAAPSTFDLGYADAARLRVEAEGERLTYYVLAQPTPLAIVQRFTALVGGQAMLPRWALGYHQSRYSYAPEADVRAVARELRARRIPCDALYFDIHYMDGYRVFTWDREAFPDPPALLADLRADGFKPVVIIDPGVKVDEGYAVFREGVRRDAFVRLPGGEPFEGEVWPGPCRFPDFLRADVRAWWGGLHRGLLEDGVAGIWNDMNEPAVFTTAGEEADAATFPDEACHAGGRSHRQAHNLYGSAMLRATWEGLRRLDPARRPFTITRACYAGAARWGTAWTGDNTASWDHLRLAAEQCLSLNVSGFPFVGTDVGGFCGAPDGELLARWTQLGALTPLFRNHSATDTPRQEPWRFGARVEAACRSAIELRYRLLPYLYTVLHQAATGSLPMLRPLAVMHPADEAVRRADPLAFYVGADLLAHPVVEPGQRRREAYLPDAPGGWYCFHTGRHYRGPSTVRVDAPLDRLPLFVRGGSVLPLGPVRQHTGEPVERLELHVYPAPGAWSSPLFEDAGDGWGFLDGHAYRCAFQGHHATGALSVTPDVEGAFVPEWKAWDVVVHGLGAAPRAVVSEGRAVEFAWDGRACRFTVAPSTGWTVRLP